MSKVVDKDLYFVCTSPNPFDYSHDSGLFWKVAFTIYYQKVSKSQN